MGVSIIIPVLNNLDVTKKCIKTIYEHNKNSAIEIIIVDNGSTDNTPRFFSSDSLADFEYGKLITYIRNDDNLGVSEACNRGAGEAGYDVLCFMHNDVFVYRDNWTVSLRNFIVGTPDAGVVGFYGAKTLRKDGSFRGKTIVHSERGHSLINNPSEKVAVVDGLLMALRKRTFGKIGGFNSTFRVHFYDKDLSVKAVQKGFDNYVLNIPYEHICGTTRKDINKDDKIRDEAKEEFLRIWSGILPVDKATLRDKMEYLIKKLNNSLTNDSRIR